MKTEFLKALGLEQETINKIMEENGKDVNAEKEKTRKAEGERDNYKTQLDTVNTKLEEFEGVELEGDWIWGEAGCNLFGNPRLR